MLLDWKLVALPAVSCHDAIVLGILSSHGIPMRAIVFTFFMFFWSGPFLMQLGLLEVPEALSGLCFPDTKARHLQHNCPLQVPAAEQTPQWGNTAAIHAANEAGKQKDEPPTSEVPAKGAKAALDKAPEAAAPLTWRGVGRFQVPLACNCTMCHHILSFPY